MADLMQIEDFRILIASTEKTGNTWLKLLLSQMYDLPTPHLEPNFSESAAEILGPRWVAHQHFFAEKRLLRWAAANRTWLLTTVRHPADLLVWLYHYCCHYPELYKDDPGIERALAADFKERHATASLAHHIVNGELIRALQDRVMSDLNISISWMLTKQSTVIRYEDLRADPASTLRHLARIIAPVPSDRIQQSIDCCEIHVLKEKYRSDSRFFRRGLPGEWRTKLPPEIIRRFRDEEPFKSQFAFLNYDLGFGSPSNEDEAAIGPPIRKSDCLFFDNGVPFVSIVAEAFANVPAAKAEPWSLISGRAAPTSLFDWLNAPADDDPFRQSGIPPITNLAVFIYRKRPDLQAAFPDPFDSSRLPYAGWFLRHAAEEYQLDRRFLTSTALGWLSRPSHPTGDDTVHMKC